MGSPQRFQKWQRPYECESETGKIIQDMGFVGAPVPVRHVVGKIKIGVVLEQSLHGDTYTTRAFAGEENGVLPGHGGQRR